VLHNDLEILVFTYNRADNLRRTLGALAESPFAGCQVTVLDNCSTDDTPAVCEELGSRFPRFRAIRHTRNIGLGPNYLRAVELSGSRYSWVLSDDELFDFSDCQDVIDAIEQGDVDLISLGSGAQRPWERGLRATTQELFARGQRYFFVFTFVAGVIFRTEQFDSHCVAAGYRNSANLYPQFEHILQCLLQNRPVYVSRSVITRRNMRPTLETVGSNMYWFVASMRSNDTISDPAIRSRAIWDAAATRAEWVRLLAGYIATERLDHPERLPRELVEIAAIFDWQQRLILLGLLPLAVVPRGVYAFVRRLNPRRRARAAAPDGQDFDTLRL
jgi:glycosyltransferase involved in cell wall biosynthesis